MRHWQRPAAGSGRPSAAGGGGQLQGASTRPARIRPCRNRRPCRPTVVRKDEFDAFVICGILARSFLRLRRTDCGLRYVGHLLLCATRLLPANVGARRMAQTAATLVDHVILHVPVRQWFQAPLRLLLAAQPPLIEPVLQAPTVSSQVP